jgi:hypothetical protein
MGNYTPADAWKRYVDAGYALLEAERKWPPDLSLLAEKTHLVISWAKAVQKSDPTNKRLQEVIEREEKKLIAIQSSPEFNGPKVELGMEPRE